VVKIVSLISLLVLVDQLSKTLVKTRLSFSNYIQVLPYRIEIMPVFNTGFVFSYKDHLDSFIVVLVTLIALSILSIIYKKYTKQKNISAAFAFLFAGGIGNGIDRILFKKVTDFMVINRQFAFNIADVYLLIGIILLIIIHLKENQISIYKKSKEVKV
jgi:signal peptidase II